HSPPPSFPTRRSSDLLRAFLRGEPVSAHPYNLLSRIQRTLARRHQETLRDDWSTVLLLEGITILIGCWLVHFFWTWEVTYEKWADRKSTRLNSSHQII